MDADRAMLLDQLNQLMSEAAGDAETMEMYKGKLAELDALRQMNLQLSAALERERARASSAESRLASVAADAEAAARAIGDQMLREKTAKEAAEAKVSALRSEASERDREAGDLRSERERLRSDVERLRGDLDAARARCRSAEEQSSESGKVLHVMRAEARAAALARGDLEAKVKSLADAVGRVRHLENEASAARCSIDTEVAALAHAVQQANWGGPPLAPTPKATIPPMPLVPGAGGGVAAARSARAERAGAARQRVQ